MNQKIWLIGGPSRIGKTTLSRKLCRHINGQVLSGDQYFRSIKKSIPVEFCQKIFPEINSTNSGKNWLNEIINRDTTYWEFLKNFIEDSILSTKTDDVLIEGNIWPNFLFNWNKKHTAVFLLDTSDKRSNFLKDIRNLSDTQNNWMKDYSDERIENWVKKDNLRNLKLLEECKKYNYTYFDRAIYSIEEMQNLAVKYFKNTL